jgi:nucleotide-binding universal stress UspA family protein
MSLAGVPNDPVLLAYDGSENAKAAIRKASRELCDGRRSIVLTVSTSQAAPKHDADIVVVGSHGRTGIIRLLLTGIASATGTHPDRRLCPVLIVKGG